MSRSHIRRAFAVLAFAVVAVAVSACGSSSKSSSSGSSTPSSSSTPTTSSTTSTTGGAGLTSTTSTSASTSGGKPGAGKPAVTLGDKNFPEEYLLGDLYQQALQAQGYTVHLKPNIGSSELIYKALKDGQIDMYPEYDGTLLTAIYNDQTPPTSAAQTYSLTQKDAMKAGFTLTQPTPFADADGLATTTSFASSNGLKTIADLSKLGSVSYGAPAENRTRYDGLVGLKKLYGLTKLQFVPLDEGLNYKALDSGQVKVATIFTTDPQLKSGKYTVLTDTKGLFGYQNVAMVLKPSTLTAEGPAFEQTINKVSALLTQDAIVKMNAAVQLQNVDAATVAKEFLQANGLL